MYRVSTCVNEQILGRLIYQKDWCMGNGSFWMSEHSRYQYLINEAPHNVGDFLNNALADFKTVNTSLRRIGAHQLHQAGRSKIPDNQARPDHHPLRSLPPTRIPRFCRQKRGRVQYNGTYKIMVSMSSKIAL